MFRKKGLKTELDAPKVSISIREDALHAIFDECDKYEQDETGGRAIGSYRKHGDTFEVEVAGIIEPGPNAKRTSVSFFQDGDYQTKIFRELEEKYPDLEHLGNWHTHHVNGLDRLSHGDIETYTKTVNHQNHNTDFFYALLVTRKHPSVRSGLGRYDVKHYFLERGRPGVFEIPDSLIKIIKKPIIWPAHEEKTVHQSGSGNSDQEVKAIRAKDREFIHEMYPSIKPFFSKKMDTLYWKGKIDLINDESVEVVILEAAGEGNFSYSIGLSESPAKKVETNDDYNQKAFESARKAICAFEKDLNRELFKNRK